MCERGGGAGGVAGELAERVAGGVTRRDEAYQMIGDGNTCSNYSMRTSDLHD